MWRIYTIQNPQDQQPLFEGFEMPADVPMKIFKALGELPVVTGAAYLGQWSIEWLRSHRHRTMSRDEAVKQLAELISDDMRFAREDGELRFKLSVFNGENIYRILSSFQPDHVSPKWGWMQRAYSVIRKNANEYSLFMPKP